MIYYARIAPAGLVYHVMNRTAGKFIMHRIDEDFAALARILTEAHEREPLRILSYCLMGNHWHFVVWPEHEGQMSRFFRWLTLTHAVRWRVAHHSVGHGHLYRGRFKAFAVQRERLLEVLRYVEANALSAKLIERAEQWRWGSLWARRHGTESLRGIRAGWRRWGDASTMGRGDLVMGTGYGLCLHQGIIFNIQRYSVHDGPGIRTTVFLKGCPLRCGWCHNPESQAVRAELMLFPDRCVVCGQCARACPEKDPARSTATEESARCIRCGKCVGVCPAQARDLVGKAMTVEQVMAEILKDELFYDDSGGGVTFSGGEPFVQPAFLLELLARCQGRGLHTAVDTCGYADPQHLLAAAVLTSLFLYDIKLMDEARHLQYTGVSNNPILENLRILARVHQQIWLRVPLIPGVNDSSDELNQMAELAASLSAVRQVNLLPFHQTAAAKLHRLGRENSLASTVPPTAEQLEQAARPFVERGIKTITGG